jgi:hypothetical protein
MPDIRLPEEIINWMTSLNWGEHHDEYHIVKRWDIWYHLAAQNDLEGKEVVAYIEANNWKRAKYQEGEPGDGLEFLAMHRAMLMMVKEEFPEHSSLFNGWKSPPTDPLDKEDPVVDGIEFDIKKSEGIQLIETNPDFFLSQDHFGIFIETTIQPTKENPNNRTSDTRYGVHNYLHNRWTDVNSPVNLGDPKVNIFNARFWKLHGWIDNAWTNYRREAGLNDEDPAYKSQIDYYIHMMQGHHHISKSNKIEIERPQRLKSFFKN